MNNRTDEDLYQELRFGDREGAFRTLYFRYSGTLFRFVNRFTTNPSSAEEVLHDIFEQLLISELTLGPDLNLRSWLFTVAKNKSLNVLKRSSREVMNEDLVGLAKDESDLELNYQNQNLLSVLTKTEIKLPPDLSQTWELRKQGMDYQQIADRLSIPVGTVKSRFSRLVEYLRKELVS